MSNRVTLDFINCRHCNTDIPQHNTKPKTFCDAKCNNEYYNFVNKVLPQIPDAELKQVLTTQLNEKVPTIILLNLVRNHKREMERIQKKENHSVHLAYFYRHLMMNLGQFIKEKNVNMIKAQVVA